MILALTPTLRHSLSLNEPCYNKWNVGIGCPDWPAAMLSRRLLKITGDLLSWPGWGFRSNEEEDRLANIADITTSLQLDRSELLEIWGYFSEVVRTRPSWH